MASPLVSTHAPNTSWAFPAIREERRALVDDGLVLALMEGDGSIIDALEGEWEALCRRGGLDHPYLRPALIKAYVDIFAPRASVFLVTARRNGQLVAVLPMVEREIGWAPLGFRWLHSAGNVHFPRFDVIHSREDPEVLAGHVWRFLQAWSRWDLVQIDSAPVDGVMDRVRILAESSGATTHLHRPEATPYIALEPTETIEDLIASQRTKLRRQLRHDHRRLEKRGPIRLIEAGWDEGSGDLADYWERFFRLEHQSWKGAAGTSILAVPRSCAFYRRLYEDRDLATSARSLILTCGEEMVSARIGLSSGETFYSLKIAFNEQYRDCSPGHMLMLYSIHALARRGYRELNLGGDADGYKMAWTTTTRPYGSVFIFRPGARGHLAHDLLFKAGQGLKRRLRDMPLPQVARRLMD